MIVFKKIPFRTILNSYFINCATRRAIIEILKLFKCHFINILLVYAFHISNNPAHIEVIRIWTLVAKSKIP